MAVTEATGESFGPATRLLAAASVSRLADEASGLAVALVVLARTGDATLAGLLAGALSLPTVVTGALVGAHLDRTTRRRVPFIAAHVALAAALGTVLVGAGHLSAPPLIAVALAAGAAAPALTGAYSGLLPALVGARDLPRVNALDAASYTFAALAGPGLVALIGTAFGPDVALTVIWALAAIGLIAVMTMPVPPPARTAAASSDEPLARALRDGLRLLGSDRVLLGVTAATTIAQLAQGLLPIVLPLLAATMGLRAETGAWLLAVMSTAGLAGALVSAPVLARLGTTRVLSAGFAIEAVAMVSLSRAEALIAAIPLAGLMGLAAGPVLAATLAIRQGHVPQSRYTQVVATAASLKIGAFALGTTLAGALTTTIGTRQTLVVGAAIELLALVAVLTAARSQRPARAASDVQ